MFRFFNKRLLSACFGSIFTVLFSAAAFIGISASAYEAGSFDSGCSVRPAYEFCFSADEDGADKV